MECSIIIASYGGDRWKGLAYERAIPSTVGQGALEVIPYHDHGGNVADARNFAAGKALGEWLCFLDPDDELAPGYLAAMRLSLDPDLALLVPRVQYVHEDGREQPPVFPNRHAPIEELNHAVIGTLVPRVLFRSVGGFRSDLPVYEDWAFTLACVRAGAHLAYVESAVYRAHVNDDGRNSVGGRVAYDTYWLIRQEHERLVTLRSCSNCGDDIADCLHRLGSLTCHDCRPGRVA